MVVRSAGSLEQHKQGGNYKTWDVYAPRKGGSFSISTFSVTTNRLLRCLRGGFPTIGMVSLGPVRRRLSVLALGGVFGPSPSEVLSIGSDSGLTTTMGGAGEALSGAEYPRCTPALPMDDDGFDRADDMDPFDPGKEWLLLLLARLLRLATAEPGCGSGLLEFGGGGGGAADDVADDLGSFVLEEDESDFALLSCEIVSERVPVY